jgi:sterol 14-demethylase
MRIVVDWDLCRGHGVCKNEAPLVFEVSRDGKLTVLLEEPPEDQRKNVEAAIRYCPTDALSLHET